MYGFVIMNIHYHLNSHGKTRIIIHLHKGIFTDFQIGLEFVNFMKLWIDLLSLLEFRTPQIKLTLV